MKQHQHTLGQPRSSTVLPLGRSLAPVRSQLLSEESDGKQRSSALNNDQPAIAAAGHNFANLALYSSEAARPRGLTNACIQPKLTIGAPSDRYEQAADRVAHQVVQRLNTPTVEATQPEGNIQRKPKPEDEEELQRKPIQMRGEAIGGGEASSDLTSAINRARGSGQPLDAGLQRSRKLPKELQHKAKSGDRARTLEETKIDAIGTGSALNSLVTSPAQTLTNAVTGLFSGFPSRATIRRQAVIQNAINTAWTAATADYNERFGWITWDKNADTYAVPAVSVGTPYACTPPPKPVDPAPGAANQVFHVGEFHLHPPLDPGDPAMANPLVWPIGPSETDETAAQADHSPGIVRDFDSVDRTGGTTDYTYGPWTRTE